MDPNKIADATNEPHKQPPRCAVSLRSGEPDLFVAADARLLNAERQNGTKTLRLTLLDGSQRNVAVKEIVNIR